MNKYSKFTESFWEFRLPEIILLLAVIILNVGFYLANVFAFSPDLTSKLNSAIFPVVPVAMIMGYIFFIIDHKIDITLNKEANSFVVMEKMLFFDKYRVNHKYQLSDILSATVMTDFHIDREHGTSVVYNVLINTKQYGAFELFKASTSNQAKYANIAMKINTFLNNDSRYLSLSENSFIFRCLSLIPIIVSLYIVYNAYRFIN